MFAAGFGLALLGTLIAPGRPVSAFDPNGLSVSLAQVGSGFASPILVTNAGDGSNRLFVVEQAGRVRNLADGPSGTPFLDISALVLSGGERGLLGLAFHPSFETNGKLYVNYTRKSDGATVIDEYRVTGDPNNVDEATRRQILAIAQPYSNHNGGHLAFGPDGYLYIGMGDGGSGGDPEDRAQNVNSYLGKMLRIDVNGTSTGKAYRVPSTNPYVGKTGLDEIWSIGLRNPWRWSFDRTTGDLWIADVGQGSWEEVNRSTAASGGGRGLNYGWDDMEGRHCYEPLTGCATAGRTLPLVEFGHAVAGDDNCSVTGGYVYRGLRYAKLVGGYFYGDFCSGRIWTVSSTAAAPATGVELLNTALRIVSFGESERGELYVVAQDGTIHQLRESTRGVIVVRR
jgi:glucose/arabinose dehydrogenase